eukprot:scaffold95271_cov37-Prasinocladus_malaysianus.AAC.2
MFVRNPYVRLLSGFLDKACNPHVESWVTLINDDYGGPYKSTPEDFARFVKILMSRFDNGEPINPHFSRLFDHCGLANGMRYDLYLK